VTRLLAVRLSALGDVIHTIPAVVALRRRYDEVAWAVEAPYRELVEIVVGVRAIPVSLKRWSPSKIVEARRDVRGFDTAIDFQGLIKSSLLARASGARERIGFAPEFIREKPASWFINRPVRIDPNKHVVEWNCELAGVDEVPNVDFSALATGNRQPATRIVILPGAGKLTKQWPRFRELAKRLSDVVVAWGPGERALAESIGAELAPPTNIRELAQLLRDARLVIGSDTGPLHLAAALGTSVVGLYGPTNPARNGPYGQLSNVVSTFSTSRSMNDISVDAVVKKVEAVLG
jgi:heptosyltransferase-1